MYLLLQKDGEPIFPYPDIWNEWYDNTDDKNWEIGYPLIKIYNENWNDWDDKRIENLRKCPLCRK